MTVIGKLSIELKFDEELLNEVYDMKDVILTNDQVRNYFIKTAEVLKNKLTDSSEIEISPDELTKIDNLMNFGALRPIIVNPESINVAVTTFRGIPV